MQNLNVEFTCKEPLPKELEGKTLSHVFDLVRIRYNEITKGIKSQDDLDKLSYDDQMYLKLGNMFKEMAKGDLSCLTGISSPYGKA